jgi:hypothetical protein
MEIVKRYILKAIPNFLQNIYSHSLFLYFNRAFIFFLFTRQRKRLQV